MKTMNLITAITYTVLYGMFILMALADGDSDLIIGITFLSVPVIVNWVTYFELKDNE